MSRPPGSLHSSTEPVLSEVEGLGMKAKESGTSPKAFGVKNLAFAPIENDLAGVAGFHQLDGFLELRVGKAVRNHR